MKFQKREEAGSRGLKVEGTIKAEIDLLVAAVGAEINLGMDEKHLNESKTMQCEFIGNYTGEANIGYQSNSTPQKYHVTCGPSVT